MATTTAKEPKEDINVEVRERRGDVHWMHPDSLEEGDNEREDFSDLPELRDSIIEIGIRNATRAYKKPGATKFTLTSGHRRFRATKMAHEMGHTHILIPVIKESRIPSPEEILVNMLVDNEGKHFNAIEIARVYARLTDYGWSASQIAAKFKKSPTHVEDHLLLTSIRPATRQLISEGKVSPTQLIALLKDKNTAAKAEDTVAAAVEKNGGKRVTAKHVGNPAKERAAKTLFDTIMGEVAQYKTEKGMIAVDDMETLLRTYILKEKVAETA